MKDQKDKQCRFLFTFTKDANTSGGHCTFIDTGETWGTCNRHVWVFWTYRSQALLIHLCTLVHY